MSSSNLKISNRELQNMYSKYFQAKSQAIFDLYDRWGKVLVEAAKMAFPIDTGRLISTINYKIYAPRSANGLIKYITMTVGQLTKADQQVAEYLKFYVTGFRGHFVPQEDEEGRDSGITDWAKRHGLIQMDMDGDFIWTTGKSIGRKFRGLFVHERAGNDIYNKLYYQYDARITRELRRILEG